MAASPAAVPLPGAPAASGAQDHTSLANAASEADWAAAMRAVVGTDARQGPMGFGAPQGAAPSPIRPAGPLTTALRPAPAPFAQPAPLAAPSVAMSQPAPTARSAPAHLQPDLAAPGYRTQDLAGAGTAIEEPAYDADEEDLGEVPRRGGWLRRVTAALASLLILGGLGWIGWQNRGLIGEMTGIGDLISGSFSGGVTADAFRVSPYVADGETRAQIDASLQKAAIWRLLKRDFREWYDERLGDVERMRAQKTDEKVISKFLADVIVTLRRRHAQTALQSSPEHLRRMSAAFVSNLKQLASRDGATCHGFVTFGEAHPFMIELVRSPTFGEPVHRQIVAIFEAITYGRANNVIHAATRRADYDALTAELTSRGWSTQDLATFSDPRQLSQAPPDKVCTLVQEWFLTQIALKDPALQARLLAESLKPLTGG